MGHDLRRANAHKSIAVRVGIISYLAGGVAALLAVLLS